MAKPRPKSNSTRKSVSAQRPPRTPTPTQTNGSQDDDDDDNAEPSELSEFLASPPSVADHVLVVAASPAGDAVVQDRTATEAKRNATLLAAQITIATEKWAQSECRTVRFRASWMRGDKTLATHAWIVQPETDTGEQQLDGSVGSFLQQQQMFAQAQHKLHLEGFEMVQEGWQKLLTLQNKRIEALERDNQELRDRLRKLDDVGSELAMETMRAEVESRGRTADLIEKKVLPLAQAVVMQKLQQGATTPPTEPKAAT